MGVELNFLEKEKRGLSPGQFIATVFAGLLLVTAGTLWFQWHTADNIAKVAASEQELAQARQMALKVPAEGGQRTDDVLQAIASELDIIKSEGIPHDRIYTETLAALGDDVTLQTFDSSDGRLVQISATFNTLDGVTAASDRLQQLPFVRSVRASDATETGGVYSAGITIQIDENGFRGEREKP